MIHALLVTSRSGSFSHLDSAFAENDVAAIWAESGNSALSMILERSFDIIITDESLRDMTGLDLTKKIISTNPMLNIALVSALSSDEFHEASEGLGILMQLSPIPKKSEAENLLERLNHILSLTKTTK
jgi:DNA-binding response OmpR family regulator